jgi:hypothetical protein
MKSPPCTVRPEKRLIFISAFTLFIGIAALLFSGFVYYTMDSWTVMPDGPTVPTFSYKFAVRMLRAYAFWLTPALAAGLLFTGYLSWKAYRTCRFERDTHVDT